MHTTSHSVPDLFVPQPSRFNGPEYLPEFDGKRLTGQLYRVFNLMRDGAWRSLAQIAASTSDPQASISAQLRHLRKKRFGLYVVERHPSGERSRGLFEYRLLPPIE